MNLSEITVWCVASSRGTVSLYFLEGIVTGAEYLNMLQVSTVPTINQLHGNKEIYYQHDRASLTSIVM